VAELPLYLVSEEARLEVETAPRRIAAEVGGRIVQVQAKLDAEVTAGQLLFELDAEVERQRLAEEVSRRQGLLAEIEALRVSERRESEGLREARAAAEGSVEEAQARRQAAEEAARLAEAEAARLARLHLEGLVAALDLDRARSLAVQRRLESQALARAEIRLQAESRKQEAERQANLARLARELAELSGEAEVAAGATRRLAEEVERRSIRAPVTGHLVEVSQVRPGSVVATGEHLATLLPHTALRVVAGFAPAPALGRLAPGQQAQLRLDAFPWAEYGVIRAVIEGVSGEMRDGKVWVEASFDPASAARIPLRHGLSGALAVEVERLSPAALLMRSIGRGLDSPPPEVAESG